MSRQFEYVPGDVLVVEWADAANEIVIFVAVDSRNDDDDPQTLRVLTLHGSNSVEVDWVVLRTGENVFQRTPQ